MNSLIIEALAGAWADVMDMSSFPQSYDGTSSIEAHRASEQVQAQIRAYIIETGDKRLFSLLHLIGQASLGMEQKLWPEEYKRVSLEIETAIHEADKPDSESVSHEAAMKLVREKIAKGNFQEKKD